MCVRVTNMKGVDVNTFTFDFDLTFAALLMNPDGTIYHTYAGRDWTDPQSHLSLPALLAALRDTLPEHEAYQRKPSPPKRRRAESVDSMPWMKARKAPACYHCHMVHDARNGERRARKALERSDLWVWPDPIQIGVNLDRDDQVRLTSVAPTSLAAKAGLKAGDRLLTLAARRVRTFGDVQRALHDAPAGESGLAVTFQRGDAQEATRLRLAKGWKEPTPLVFSWRPSKWPLSPKPGFGGPRLKPEQLERLGLPKDAFAFRVQYLVTWGENAYTGQNARKAGLRKNDIVVSVGGKRNFESVAHFHAWFRLTRKPGTSVALEILRNGKPRTLELPVLP